MIISFSYCEIRGSVLLYLVKRSKNLIENYMSRSSIFEAFFCAQHRCTLAHGTDNVSTKPTNYFPPSGISVTETNFRPGEAIVIGGGGNIHIFMFYITDSF